MATKTDTIEPEATEIERRQINDAIIALKRAKETDCERVMMRNLQDAFTITRNVHRSRNDV